MWMLHTRERGVERNLAQSLLDRKIRRRSQITLNRQWNLMHPTKPDHQITAIAREEERSKLEGERRRGGKAYVGTRHQIFG